MTDERTLTRCRATINLVGAKVGDEVLVDLSKPGIAELVEAGYLIPVESTTPAEVAPSVEDAAVGSQEAPGADEPPEATESTTEP